ncbi:MAG: L-seryl-tRNA(Sec) selenium transferase [Anaerolineae bacterium]|nr:L-seryl-tRNA(Sec) selenium transferase [Anaerolineae bacterium]
MDTMEELRRLPGVDALLQHPEIEALVADEGRPLVTEAVRAVLEEARAAILAGATCPQAPTLVARVAGWVAAWGRPSLRPVINATGVVIHTNLGRAPLCDAALEAMVAVGRGYSNLEYDLEAGRRGSRYVHASDLLCRLTGAEAALVVNNNAGAVLLALSALAQGREVVISRGQLIEIGGGFRIPDVMRQSGAVLVEVGTTNRTHLRDYAAAIGPETGMLMVAHQSNYRMIGFTTSVPARDLVDLAHAHGLIVFEDLGSGTLLDTARYGFTREPTPQEALEAGIDLVSFSGDKLLGAPQAGVLVGRAELIARLRSHPLTRALRVDKATLAGLQATLLQYVRGEAERSVPVWQLLALSLDELAARAQRWAERLQDAGIEASVIDGRSAAGGGSLPGESVPTRLLAIAVPSPDGAAARLRAHDPAVIARIEHDLLCIDPRTVLEGQEDALLGVLCAVLGEVES